MNWRRVSLAAYVLCLVGCGADRALRAADLLPPADAARARMLEDPPNDTLGPEQFEGQQAVKIRAQVNGVAILDDEIEQAAYGQLIQINNLPEPERTVRKQEIIRVELEKLIERELIMADALWRMGKNPQAIEKLYEAASKEFDKQVRSMKERAKAQGFDASTDEKFAALLETQGMTMASMRRQLERGFMSMEYMRHRIYPAIEKHGVAQFRQYYDEHPGEFQAQDRVKWQVIFVAEAKHPSREAARAFAQQIAERVQRGEDFPTLSKQYDDGDGVLRNGDGLGARRGEIRPPEVEPILFRMREGEVGPVVETSTGFYVIRVTEREYAGLLPFDEKVQGEIKKKLQNIIADREYKRIINELKRNATVQIVK